MNNLSITLYLVDVVGNLKPFFIGLCAVFGFVAFISALGYFLSSEKQSITEEVVNNTAKKYGGKAAFAAIFCLLFAVIIPTEETLKYIAISETVEEVLTTASNNETVKIALDGVKNYLKESVSNMKE